jgi:hypothetical protein
MSALFQLPARFSRKNLFFLEVPKGGKSISWSNFRRRARWHRIFPGQDSPRTRPIRDIEIADQLLALWTPSGRIAAR